MGIMVGFLDGGSFSCTKSDLPEEKALAHPLRSLRFYSDKEIFVSAASGVPLSSLVDLSVFDRLWPGIDADEARKLMGQPQRVYQQFNGRDTVYVFPRQGGVLEVLSQNVDSEGYKGFRWFLRWRPVDRNPKAHLRPEILASLPDLRTIASLGVESDDGKASFEFEDGLISSIFWLRRGPVKVRSIH